MFLSQLILNKHSREVQRDIASPYQMHRTLTTRCFAETAIVAQQNQPRATANDAHGLLFRLDTDPRTGNLVVLAQSRAHPNWSGLPNGYALDVHGPKDYELAGRLAVGQVFRFRLRASPTKRLGNSTVFKEDIGKRVPIKIESDQLKWLENKALQHGFSIIRAQVGEKNRQFGHKTGQDMHWHSVCFDGLLRIDSPDDVRRAIEAGIGTAKGMGFGLLSLAPVA